MKAYLGILTIMTSISLVVATVITIPLVKNKLEVDKLNREKCIEYGVSSAAISMQDIVQEREDLMMDSETLIFKLSKVGKVSSLYGYYNETDSPMDISKSSNWKLLKSTDEIDNEALAYSLSLDVNNVSEALIEIAEILPTITTLSVQDKHIELVFLGIRLESV